MWMDRKYRDAIIAFGIVHREAAFRGRQPCVPCRGFQYRILVDHTTGVTHKVRCLLCNPG